MTVNEIGVFTVAGKKDKTLKYVVFKTKLGYFGLAGSEKGLVRTELPLVDEGKVEKRLLSELNGAVRDRKYQTKLQNDIKSYYKGTYDGDFKKVPVDYAEMTSFQASILKACRRVKPRRTMSYSDLAKSAGNPKAARAVGSVLAKNPVPLIIPCHRVLRKDGKLGGFSAAGGVKVKKQMLDLESQGK